MLSRCDLLPQGSDDMVIDICHGRTLHKLAQRPSAPLFLEGYTHDDVECSPDYVPALQRFMSEIFPDLAYETPAGRRV